MTRSRCWVHGLGRTREDVEIVVIPGAEHELTLPDGTLAPEYERTLVDWLVRRSGA